MFLTGFIFASVLTYLISSEQEVLPLGGEIGVAIGAGLILGLPIVPWMTDPSVDDGSGFPVCICNIQIIVK